LQIYSWMVNLAATPARKRVVLAGLFLAAAVLILQAGEVGYAGYLMDSGNLGRMERGAAIAPGNADSWDRLGRYYSLDFVDPNPDRAIENYQKAVRLDPLSAHFWLDLANAYESRGDNASARGAFENARRVYPSSAEVAWYYGNFLIRVSDAAGYTEIERAVRDDPSFLELAISRVWRSNDDIDVLLRAIPSDAQSLLAALDFFSSRQDSANGLIVWRHLVALHEPLPLHSSFSFIEELIREDDSRDASRVWEGALAASNNRPLEPAAGNLISDGGFAGDFPNGGLGWRWRATSGAVIDFGTAPPSTRTRSIKLGFSGGTNLQVDQPSQFVSVEPSTPYHFHALISTEEISTDSGMIFLLTDPHHPSAPGFSSENLTGTHPWTSVDANFTTGPETHFLLVRLHRDPSHMFESRLSGLVWIADVSLFQSVAQENRPQR
jgi:tetratricopeptide (TPR) repeat protein